MLGNATIWIFTLGLTETWFYETDQNALPVHPGVLSQESYEDKVFFRNLSYEDVQHYLILFMNLVRNHQPEARFIYTVSPIPLNATYESRNVLVSTCASKSILRAACDHAVNKHDFADYFPSFEIVSTHLNLSRSFLPDNPRRVSKRMVEFVMSYFAKTYGLAKKPFLLGSTVEKNKDELVCEEALYNSLK